jgi:DNA-binding NarL/FixJ family response regulator
MSAPAAANRARGHIEVNDTGVVALVVDGEEGQRADIVSLLKRAGWTTLEAATGEQGLALAREQSPSVLVLDVCLPDISGYTVCRQLRDEFGDDLTIVFASALRAESYDRVAGLMAGGDEYFAKPLPADEFFLRVKRLLDRRTRTAAATEQRPAGLTARELEILRLLADGLGQKEIAIRLFLSPKTVSSHIERIYKKLGVRSRTQALSVAFRNSLVDASP